MRPRNGDQKGANGMSDFSRYRVNVTRRGPPPRPFGWEICRSDDGTEVQRSAGTFRARHEALSEAERIVQSLDGQDDNRE